MTGRRLRAHAQVADLRPDLVRLALVVAVDVLFLFGVLLPYLTYDGDVADSGCRTS